MPTRPEVFVIMQKIPRRLASEFLKLGVKVSHRHRNVVRIRPLHSGTEVAATRPSASENLISVAALRTDIQTIFHRFLTNLWILAETFEPKVQTYGGVPTRYFLFLVFTPAPRYCGLVPGLDELVQEALNLACKEVRTFVFDEPPKVSFALYPASRSAQGRSSERFMLDRNLAALPRQKAPGYLVALARAYALAESA
ncbi:MAG: hypothetical protein HY397_03030 [Candidatus Doudnabacteria bacterium]|nr:hypothetical protein [Candidatus Doudnabacteria bacterium]